MVKEAFLGISPLLLSRSVPSESVEMTEGECVACPDTKRGGKENHLPQRTRRSQGTKRAFTAENAESAEKATARKGIYRNGREGRTERPVTDLRAKRLFRTSHQMPRTRPFPWLPARWFPGR